MTQQQTFAEAKRIY